MEGTEYFVSLQTSVVITEECNGMLNSDELIGATEYLTLETSWRINRCRYKRVRLYLYVCQVRRAVIRLKCALQNTGCYFIPEDEGQFKAYRS
jgi:hypothetical protein